MMTYDPSEEDELLREYLKAVDSLTLDDANRLKRANVKLVVEVNEIQNLKTQMEKQTEEMAQYKKQAAQSDDAMMTYWPQWSD